MPILSKLLIALAVAAAAIPSAHAQVGIYATLSGVRVSNPASAQSNAYGGTNTGYWTTGGGIDYTILPHVDFRAIEIGGGQISGGISTAATGTRSIFTLSSGLAARF